MTNKKLDKEEQRILDLLPTGMDRPRPLAELVTLTGLSNRIVRATINRLIVLHHQPIGVIYTKPGNGYFIITNDRERNIALAPLTSQINMMAKRAQVLSNAPLGDD